MHRRKFATVMGAAVAGIVAGSQLARPAFAQDRKKAKEHDCAGKNECKGMGGCKTGDNGCKGKNSCKGKGGCSTMSKESKGQKKKKS